MCEGKCSQSTLTVLKNEESSKTGEISSALVKAQSQMGKAVKGSENPFFKSKYADISEVIEVCKEPLNSNGITILQEMQNVFINNEIHSFIKTKLLHESSEFISSMTPIISAKKNDPQAMGSAITYSRRYGLQTLLSIPAEDSDGERAMDRKVSNKIEKPTERQEETKKPSFSKFTKK